MKKSVSCNKFPSLHLIKSIIFYLLAVDQLPLRPPLIKGFFATHFIDFLLWISFKNMKKSVSCNKFPSLHLIKSIIFYLLAADQLPLRSPLKSPKFVFSSQNHAILLTFFSKKYDFSTFFPNSLYNSLYYHKNTK